MHVLYTNADCLLNKRAELANLINCYTPKPDIIGTVEAKPKNYRELPELSEYSLTGYDTHHMNMDKTDGRGIILYAASWLQASPYTPDCCALESVWAAIKLLERETLTVGCMYRSPSSSPANDSVLIQQIKK